MTAVAKDVAAGAKEVANDVVSGMAKGGMQALPGMASAFLGDGTGGGNQGAAGQWYAGAGGDVGGWAPPINAFDILDAKEEVEGMMLVSYGEAGDAEEDSFEPVEVAGVGDHDEQSDGKGGVSGEEEHGIGGPMVQEEGKYDWMLGTWSIWARLLKRECEPLMDRTHAERARWERVQAWVASQRNMRYDDKDDDNDDNDGDDTDGLRSPTTATSSRSESLRT